ncbi:hypothetical protein [Microcoleus sp. LEGE 07076]|nr:hypothetical protein [Microcoleus sp. LEGE 07076]
MLPENGMTCAASTKNQVASAVFVGATDDFCGVSGFLVDRPE